MFFVLQRYVQKEYLCNSIWKFKIRRCETSISDITQFQIQMDYNTQREKLEMPEYGRYIQQMIEQVKVIPDREKRNVQMQAVINAMAVLNPQPKDVADARRKYWDQAFQIAGYDLDVDSPYPVPSKSDYDASPQQIKLETTPLKAAHYGRNIQNMIDEIAARPDGEIKDQMIKAMASYMRQQYLIWNKDTVSEETIFSDIAKLSEGRLIVPENIHLDAVSSKENFSRPGIMAMDSSSIGFNRQYSKGNKKNNSKKRWKK